MFLLFGYVCLQSSLFTGLSYPIILCTKNNIFNLNRGSFVDVSEDDLDDKGTNRRRSYYGRFRGSNIKETANEDKLKKNSRSYLIFSSPYLWWRGFETLRRTVLVVLAVGILEPLARSFAVLVYTAFALLVQTHVAPYRHASVNSVQTTALAGHVLIAG